MITLLPVAVAITTSGLPPPRDQYFSRAASAACWYGRSSNMAIMDGRRLAQMRRPNSPGDQRFACQGAGPAGAGLDVFAADATLVAAPGLAGSSGCSGSSDFASNGKMREILFLSA